MTRPQPNSCMKIPWSWSSSSKMAIITTYTLLLLISLTPPLASPAPDAKKVEYDEFGDPKTPDKDPFGGDGDGGGKDDGGKKDDGKPSVPKGFEGCTGIYVTYNFNGKEKLFPHLRNTTAQPWSFKSQIAVVNMGLTELKSWEVFVGFHHREVIISLDGGQMIDAGEFPSPVGKNGTVIAGYPHSDLKTAADTAGDMNTMAATVNIVGTVFGVGKAEIPMPKSVKLANEGWICPGAKKRKSSIEMCCVKDKKYKPPKLKISKRRYGDLNILYDVTQAFGNNYFVQVTMNNDHPLGRLDHWNLTWDWMRGEFIYSMKGAYTSLKNPSSCIYGPAGNYYGGMDFSTVLTCEKSPIIYDLPKEMKNDDKVGRLPYCCRNGTLLPKTMNESESISIFSMNVFKLPPDLNRTAIYPPQNWRIKGVVNPHYKCGPPLRVDPTEFPDPMGLNSKTLAIASWEITCNITKPKEHENKCCVTFSSYFNDSVIPCNTCACGCDSDTPTEKKCSTKAPSMLLPPEALLVPYDNRTRKQIAWARIKHLPVWTPKPCPDNCRVTINWHLDADFAGGWTARMTLFNWGDVPFEDWFAAVQLKGKATLGYEKAYSFNGTLNPDGMKDTVFLQGLPGLNFLIAEGNGTRPGAPRVPGKQQTVISFKKNHKWKLRVPQGDGFPKKIIFNGEECALPRAIPIDNGAVRTGFGRFSGGGMVTAAAVSLVTLLLLMI